MSRNRARHGPPQQAPGETPWGDERVKTWRDKAKLVFVYGPPVLIFGVVPAALLYNPKFPGTSLMFLAGSWLIAYLVGEVRRAHTRAALVRPLVMLVLAGLVGAGAMESQIKGVARPTTRASGTFAGATSIGFISCAQWALKGEDRDKYKLCTTKPKPKGDAKGTIKKKADR